MSRRSPIAVERLREFICYDAEAGTLTWRPRARTHFASDHECTRWNSRYAGRPALSTPRPDGYLGGCLDGRSLLAHRVALAIANGQWPEEVDHGDGDRSNNRRANLRDVTRQENMRNKARYRTNKSGTGGVHWSAKENGWIATIGRCSLGLYSTQPEANAARAGALRALAYHENQGRPAPSA